MIPGEYRIAPGEIDLNVGRRTLQLEVRNVGDRPIQVGSHFPFCEVNSALVFDRDAALDMRLDIAAGTAVRFEPGEEKPVMLVEVGGDQLVFGANRRTESLRTESLRTESLRTGEQRTKSLGGQAEQLP